MKRPKRERPHRPFFFTLGSLVSRWVSIAVGVIAVAQSGPTKWKDQLTSSTLIAGIRLTSKFPGHTGIAEAQEDLRLFLTEKFNIEHAL
jgi:hypothetical protein